MKAVAGVMVIVVLLMAVLVEGYNLIAGKTTGTVIVSWDQNKEKDLAGYKIHFGNQPMYYDVTIDVGNVTEYTIADLATERRWYFAATAYDTAKNESRYSDEVSIYLAEDDTNTVTVNFGYYNFPNPFDPREDNTFIRFWLETEQVVSIVIYDSRERLVRKLLTDAVCRAGEHFEPWDGRNESGDYVANGVYYAVIVLEGKKKVVQMAVVR